MYHYYTKYQHHRPSVDTYYIMIFFRYPSMNTEKSRNGFLNCFFKKESQSFRQEFLWFTISWRSEEKYITAIFHRYWSCSLAFVCSLSTSRQQFCLLSSKNKQWLCCLALKTLCLMCYEMICLLEKKHQKTMQFSFPYAYKSMVNFFRNFSTYHKHAYYI